MGGLAGDLAVLAVAAVLALLVLLAAAAARIGRCLPEAGPEKRGRPPLSARG